MAFLYSDENFPLGVVSALRAFGEDVVAIQERGRGDQGVPDSDVLQLATLEGRAVLTLDRFDFVRLHRVQPGHAEIIVCSADRSATAPAARIHAAVSEHADLHGLLLRVNLPAG